jgi:hypothetical protein
VQAEEMVWVVDVVKRVMLSLSTQQCQQTAAPVWLDEGGEDPRSTSA